MPSLNFKSVPLSLLQWSLLTRQTRLRFQQAPTPSSQTRTLSIPQGGVPSDGLVKTKIQNGDNRIQTQDTSLDLVLERQQSILFLLLLFFFFFFSSSSSFFNDNRNRRKCKHTGNNLQHYSYRYITYTQVTIYSASRTVI